MDCDTFLKEHPKAMLFHISQDEFDHGKTRNLAVSIRMRKCLSA